jgi:co-chaperonin GroES (HSP10)
LNPTWLERFPLAGDDVRCRVCSSVGDTRAADAPVAPTLYACSACLISVAATLDLARLDLTAERRSELHGFVPLSDGLLLELDLPPEKVGSIYLAPSAVTRKGHDTWSGRVLKVGPGFLEPNGRTRELQCRVGDRVCFPAFLGHDVKLDGKPYRLVYERDVCARDPATSGEATLTVPPELREVYADPHTLRTVVDGEPINEGHVHGSSTWSPEPGEVDGGIVHEEGPGHG